MNQNITRKGSLKIRSQASVSQRQYSFNQKFKGKIHKIGKQGPNALFNLQSISLSTKNHEQRRSTNCRSQMIKRVKFEHNKQNCNSQANRIQQQIITENQISLFRLPSIKRKKIKQKNKFKQERIL